MSSDSQESKTKSKLMFGNDTIMYDETNFVRGNKVMGLKIALAEILIASSSDRLFLSPFSSFSRVIGMYASTPHVYMVSDYGVPEQDTHRTFTNIVDHCYRYNRKDECAWPGHKVSSNDLLRNVTCYDESMISDIC